MVCQRSHLGKHPVFIVDKSGSMSRPKREYMKGVSTVTYKCQEHGEFTMSFECEPPPKYWCTAVSKNCCGNERPCGLPSERTDAGVNLTTTKSG